MTDIEAEWEEKKEEEIKELRACLRYLLYARLPAGDKICDHIPHEWYKRSYEVLGDK